MKVNSIYRTKYNPSIAAISVLTILVFVFILVLATSSQLIAKEGDKKSEAITTIQKRKKQDKPPVKVGQDAVQIFLDKIEIFGRIEKPQTVFIIPGTDPRVDGIRINRNFFKDIFRKVEKDSYRRKKADIQKDHIPW